MLKFFNNRITKNFCKFISIKDKIKNERNKRLGKMDNKIEINDESSKIRNISIVAHIDAGKTTVTERMLYYSGIIPFFGEVHEGNTTMDFMEEEKERGITIKSSCISLTWNDKNINLVDTPGHVDFGFEVERALRVSDSCIVILDTSMGVQAQTETVWLQANKYNLNKLVFLNKFDKMGSNLEFCIKNLRDKINVNPLIMNLYIDENNILDVISGKIYKYIEINGNNIEISDIQKDHKFFDLRIKYLEDIIGELSIYDDSIFDDYLENNLNYIDKIYKNLKKLLLKNSDNICLVYCGSALKNRGIQFLLDAITNYLPSPNDIEEISLLNEFNKIVKIDSNISNLILYCFKVQNFKNNGITHLFRVFTGKIKFKELLWNSNNLEKERVNNLYKIKANNLEKIEEGKKGDIIAITGLNNIKSGDTIVSSNNSGLYKFENNKDISFVFSCSILFEKSKDKDKVLKYLSIFKLEDPSFNFYENKETGEIILQGLGELHLEIYKQRLYSEYKININLENLKVYNKETISEMNNQNYEINRMVNKELNFMNLEIETSKNEETNDKIGIHSSNKSYINYLPNNNIIEFSFFETISNRKNYEEYSNIYFNSKGKNLLKDIKNKNPFLAVKEVEIDTIIYKLYKLSTLNFNILVTIEKALRNSFYQGCLLSNEIINTKIEIKSGFISNNLNNISFVSNFIIDSVQNSFKNSSPNLMEPMYEIEIVTNQEYSKEIINDLISNRDGKIIEITTIENNLNNHIKKSKILAKFPIFNSINYINYLRSITKGEVIFNLYPSGYDIMNYERMKKIIKNN